MSNDTMVTVQGWLGGDPTLREVNGIPVASFRMGCTPRRYHRGREEWVEGTTQWYTVSVWRGLAENCRTSLHKGDPVVVYGRLNHRSFSNKNGVEVTALEIDAITVGHDLSRGITAFSKTVGGGARRDQRAEEPWAPDPRAARPAEPDPWAPRPEAPAAVAAADTGFPSAEGEGPEESDAA